MCTRNYFIYIFLYYIILSESELENYTIQCVIELLYT